MLHIKTYIHANIEKSPLPDDWQKTVDNVSVCASRKLSELGFIQHDTVESIELNLMSNEQIALINKRLRNIDSPTDVISLKLGGGAHGIHQADLPEEIFGEIYISIEKCAAQAEEIGQSFIEELSFLLVHGILHIFDYDHQTSEAEAGMMKIANEILGRGYI